MADTVATPAAASSDAGGASSTDPKALAATPTTPASSAAGVESSKGTATSSSTAGDATAPKPPVDLKLTAKEVADLRAKAKWERGVREREAATASRETEYGRFKTFDDLVDKGDAVGALRALKGDDFVDKLLHHLNEQIINEAEQDPVKKQVAKALEEAEAARARKLEEAAAAEDSEVKTTFMGTADKFLDQDGASYPATLRALAVGKISRDNVWATAKAMHARDGNVSYKGLYDYIESALNPKPAAPPVPTESAKAAPGAGNVSDLSASAAPGVDPTDSMSKDELLAHLKKQAGIVNKRSAGGYWR